MPDGRARVNRAEWPTPLQLEKGDQVESEAFGAMGQIKDFAICALLAQPSHAGTAYEWVPITALKKKEAAR